jgi:hypothetical protein
VSRKQEFSFEFEAWVADYYKRKADSARSRGLDFRLNLVSFRNLLRTVKCPYTGVALTVPRPGKPSLHSDITIDRIDNSKGYVKNNVMAISYQANNLKSLFENPQYMNLEEGYRVLGKMAKRVNKTKEVK